MNKRKQFALNKLFNFCVVLGLFLAWLSYSFFRDGEVAWGIGNGIAALLLIVLPATFTPYCYAFDSKGVSLCYVFLPVERYLWKDIYAIEVEDKQGYLGSKRSLLVYFLYASVFSIYGSNVGKCRFYMNGNIRKSFRTKHLLEKYWDGTITGYLFEDAQRWINKRKNRKQAQIKAYSTDEVVSMEREIRSEARELLKPFISQAKQLDLDVKTKYIYITKDLEKLNSRPEADYTYTLVVEIQNLNGNVDFSVDLLYVRLGKNAFRGVKNKYIKEELKFALFSVSNDIK